MLYLKNKDQLFKTECYFLNLFYDDFSGSEM